MQGSWPHLARISMASAANRAATNVAMTASMAPLEACSRECESRGGNNDATAPRAKHVPFASL